MIPKNLEERDKRSKLMFIAKFEPTSATTFYSIHQNSTHPTTTVVTDVAKSLLFFRVYRSYLNNTIPSNMVATWSNIPC